MKQGKTVFLKKILKFLKKEHTSQTKFSETSHYSRVRGRDATEL
jgi:hypothetical protein